MDSLGQDGINERFISVCLQDIQGYKSLFEGTKFGSGYLEALQR